MFLTTTFIVIMIYAHHVFVMNTMYERWSLLGKIPRLSSNKVNKKDIRHLIYYRHFHFRYQQHNTIYYNRKTISGVYLYDRWNPNTFYGTHNIIEVASYEAFEASNHDLWPLVHEMRDPVSHYMFMNNRRPPTRIPMS
jgi:hypothetical protein